MSRTEQLPGGIGISLEYENRRWRLYRIWNTHSSQELGGLGLDKEQQVWTLDAFPIEHGGEPAMIELQRFQGPDDGQFRQQCVKLLLQWRASQLRDLYHRPRKAPPVTAMETYEEADSGAPDRAWTPWDEPV